MAYDIHDYVSVLNRLTLISMSKPTNAADIKLASEINKIISRITPTAGSPAAHLLDVEKCDDVRDICFDSLQFTYDLNTGKFKSNGADFERLAELNAGTLKQNAILYTQINASQYSEEIRQKLTEYIKYHGELGIIYGFITTGMQFLQWRKSTLYRREIYRQNKCLVAVLEFQIRKNFPQLESHFTANFKNYLKHLKEFDDFNDKCLKKAGSRR
ncbi:MAG: hypothetical protein CMK92_04795 [Pseudomonas sp.]|nr:hypothetical protein [Pseudomonas sp.]